LSFLESSEMISLLACSRFLYCYFSFSMISMYFLSASSRLSVQRECGLRDEVVGHEPVRRIRPAARDQALLVPVPTGDRQGRVEALIVSDGPFLEHMKSKRGLTSIFFAFLLSW
jgi:hypothetical protein